MIKSPEEKYKENENLHIKLGDIIEIEAPSNPDLNNKILFIKYLDPNKIILIDNETLNETILTIKDSGELDDESIEGINILSKPEYPGYAMQNSLIPSTWIDIYFGGNVPLVITGEITNLENDMIEITTFPEEEIIYIDFAYKGLPEELQIEKILIRTSPEQQKFDDEVTQDQAVKEDQLNSQLVDKQKYDPTIQFESVEDTDLMIASPVPIQGEIGEILLDADQIQIGTELENLVQLVEVSDDEKRFSIEQQTNDMLDELLSRIPNADRTQIVLNNIHIIIERYIQLRNEYSNFDNNMNATLPNYKGSSHKPLIKHIGKLDKKLYWLLPVATTNKKMYENEEKIMQESDTTAMTKITMSDSLIEQHDIISNWKNNSIQDEQNRYNHFMRSFNQYMTPFTNNDAYHITSQDVRTNINAIIDINGDYKSYVTASELLTQKRFCIQVYNVGITRLQAIEDEIGHNRHNELVNLTNNDTIHIKSFITLPEPTVLFSHINLPSTDIMTRSNLNMNFLNYWQLLTNDTHVNTFVIDNLDKPFEFDAENYLNNFKEFILDETIQERDETIQERDEITHISPNSIDIDKSPKKEIKSLYEKYLNAFIPNNQVLFKLINKYIVGKISLYKVLNLLEPFMIYQNDISFKQYEEIKIFISKKIEDYKKTFSQNKNIQRLYEKKYGNNFSNELTIQTMFNILTIDQEIQKIVFDSYNISIDLRKILKNEEIYERMINVDYANLFMSAVSKISTDLMVSDILQEFLTIDNQIDQKIESVTSKDECRKYVLTKKYFAADEMLDDNNINIFFDKKYDQTMYDIAKEYKNEQRDMQPDEFRELLIQKLMDNIGLDRMAASRDAIAMIDGRRAILDGDFALLEQDGSPSEIYVRENNIWVRDENLSINVFFDNNKLFCNTQDNCYNIDNDCVDMKHAQDKVQKETMKEMIGEFDEKYRLAMQEIKTKINEEYEYYKHSIAKLINIDNSKKLAYNNYLLKIADTAEELDTIESPYENIRDIILGQTDFIKRQNDLLRFSRAYTRSAYDNESEDMHWLYCIKTNVKLIPQFLVRLAGVFANNGDYYRELDKICAEQGTISDDGDAWVDKYSGYEIRKIDLDTEEGFTEEGMKLKTRDIIEEDLGNMILQADQNKGDKAKVKKYSNPEAQIISNVVTTISNFMGINVDSQKEFIIKSVMSTQKKAMPKQEDYERAVKKAVESGKKKPPSFDMAYNESLLILTFVFLLVGIQVSVPSIITRKTFPGCIKSFVGYPMEGHTDKTSLTYIACVAFKIKSTIEPWNSISRSNQDSIIKKMTAFIEKYIHDNSDVISLFNKKKGYLQLNKEEIIPETLDIKNWINFMPPLVHLKISAPINIDANFYTELKRNILTGSKAQREQLSVIQSKIILFSLAIIESIQKVVAKESPILTNSSMEPFLENACCNEIKNAILYFIEKDKSIISYNDIVISLSDILFNIRKKSCAGVYFDSRNTKYQYPAIPKNYIEETIYKAFIYFCKFNSQLPINDELRAICLEKPEDINNEDTIEDIISKLKASGRNYTSESLEQLMNIINSNNIVHVNFSTQRVNNITILRELLLALDKRDSEIIPSAFREKFIAMLDTYDIALTEDSKEMRDFKNYLASTNLQMKDTINNYILNNSKLNSRKYSEFKMCLENIVAFDNPNYDSNMINKSIVFIKNNLKKLTSIFPNIIINSVDYKNINIPKHWKLSDRHNLDIINIINKYYSGLSPFYGDPQLNVLLNKIQHNSSDIDLLSIYTLYMSPVIVNGVTIYSVFDVTICNALFTYYLYNVLLEYINLENNPEVLTTANIMEQKELENIDTNDSDNDEEEDRDDQYYTNANENKKTKVVSPEKDELGIIGNFDIIRGEKKALSMKIANLIIEFVKMTCDNQGIFEYDYDSIMDKVHRAKEKEKNIITDYLKNMTDEERSIENVLKNNKLEKWNVGLQKGLTQYVQDTYDGEREAMEKQALKEFKIGENNQVTAMNKDIFIMDYDNEQQVAADIENEEYDMSMLPEDDDFGDEDGDEYY
jgi:hypothetical protein